MFILSPDDFTCLYPILVLRSPRQSLTFCIVSAVNFLIWTFAEISVLISVASIPYYKRAIDEAINGCKRRSRDSSTMFELFKVNKPSSSPANMGITRTDEFSWKSVRGHFANASTEAIWEVSITGASSKTYERTVDNTRAFVFRDRVEPPQSLTIR